MKNAYLEPPIQNHDETANLVRLLHDLPTDQVVQTMNYAWIDPGKQLKEHKHVDCIEYYYFLSGNGEMEICEEEFLVKKGDFVTVEMDRFHTLSNTGKGKLEFITLRALVC